MEDVNTPETTKTVEIAPIKDKGMRAWAVCFTVCCVNGSVFGIMNTFGILFAAMMDEFENTGQSNLAFRLCRYHSQITYNLIKFLNLLINKTFFIGFTKSK